MSPLGIVVVDAVMQGESTDGAQREGLRPAVYKTVQPPINDMNFRSLCANIESRVVFGHIRAASSTSITAVNNHPFVFGRHCEPTSPPTN